MHFTLLTITPVVGYNVFDRLSMATDRNTALALQRQTFIHYLFDQVNCALHSGITLTFGPFSTSSILDVVDISQMRIFIPLYREPASDRSMARFPAKANPELSCALHCTHRFSRIAALSIWASFSRYMAWSASKLFELALRYACCSERQTSDF